MSWPQAFCCVGIAFAMAWGFRGLFASIAASDSAEKGKEDG